MLWSSEKVRAGCGFSWESRDEGFVLDWQAMPSVVPPWDAVLPEIFYRCDTGGFVTLSAFCFGFGKICVGETLVCDICLCCLFWCGEMRRHFTRLASYRLRALSSCQAD